MVQMRSVTRKILHKPVLTNVELPIAPKGVNSSTLVSLQYDRTSRESAVGVRPHPYSWSFSAERDHE